MSESVDPLAGERCADCPGALAPEPVPVLGPYLGVVGAVLCILVGAFLLLAPYAFDYRDGAATAPRGTVVDLATGGVVAAVGMLTAALFGGSLARRLRPAPSQPEYAAEPFLPPAVPEAAGEDTEGFVATADGPQPQHTAEFDPAGQRIPDPRPSSGPPAPAPTPDPAPIPVADPAGALRDLLTPLVAALAADLRARESSGETEGKHL